MKYFCSLQGKCCTYLLNTAVFKNSKKSIWNESANTTNNTIKYLIFKNENPFNLKLKNELQNDFEDFLSNSYVFEWEWYKSLKKYTEILNLIKKEVEGNKFSSYKDLNDYYLNISNDDVDFLERYLYMPENGISSIKQGNIYNWKRDELSKQINLTPEILFEILKLNDAQACYDLLLPLIFDDKNRYAVAYRFTRTLFPDVFTSVDATGKFNDLLRKLKNVYQIDIKQKNQIPQNKEIVDLVTSDDAFAKQIFFWELLNESLKVKDDEIIINKDNRMKKHSLNKILFGPPGTGKTYNTIDKAIMIIDNLTKEEFYIKYKSRDLITNRFKELLITDLSKMNGQVLFTTFHQSMSYEDFIEGIKPETKGDNVIYEIQDGIFKKLANLARSNFENSKKENQSKLSFELAFEQLKEEWEENTEIKFPLLTAGYDYTILGFTNYSIQFKKASGGTGHTLSINTLKDLYYGKELNIKQGVGIYYPSILKKLLSYTSNVSEVKLENYVIIIDEINRGNVSQIFGELITLIEDDKRIGENEELFISLPYNKSESFGVPPNLYIIGTMNTADRSVEALDTALRRRFVFEEMNAKPELIATDGKSKETNGVVEGINLVQLLVKINARIEKLLDKDHQIGHAFFMSVSSKLDLEIVFENKIIPLLQEYFYGDYGKIGLVLGESFLELETQISDFAPFNHYDDNVKRDFQEKKSYKVKNKEHWNYESIYLKNKITDVNE